VKPTSHTGRAEIAFTGIAWEPSWRPAEIALDLIRARSIPVFNRVSTHNCNVGNYFTIAIAVKRSPARTHQYSDTPIRIPGYFRNSRLPTCIDILSIAAGSYAPALQPSVWTALADRTTKLKR